MIFCEDPFILASVWNVKILLNKNIPNKLKLTDATPIFLKKDKNFAMNYRLVSVLPAYSKIFERIMHKPMNYYISNLLWKHFVEIEKDSVHNMHLYF